MLNSPKDISVNTVREAIVRIKAIIDAEAWTETSMDELDTLLDDLSILVNQPDWYETHFAEMRHEFEFENFYTLGEMAESLVEAMEAWIENNSH